MTTFQYIIDSIITSLSQFLPVPKSFYWAETPPELLLLVTLIGSLLIIYLFRFDVLGLFSALIKSIFSPSSLRADRRSLDQHITLFLLISSLPFLLVKYGLHSQIESLFSESNFFIHPFVNAGLQIASFLALGFAINWNKRLKGLNHLKLADTAWVASLSLLSVHPALPLPILLWIAFSVCNYHYESIFKYSMLIIGMDMVLHALLLFKTISFHSIFETIGHLNAVAVVVVVMTTFWMGLESLQKNMNESTLRLMKWLQVLGAAASIAFYFIKASS